MKIGCFSFKCSECCKRYWITLLPYEAKRIAEKLSLPLDEFIEKKCVLVAFLYARKSSGEKLSISSNRLPAKIASFAEQEFGTVPNAFLLLPVLALNRNSKGWCSMLKRGRCEVHNVAPVICQLFPSIAVSKRTLRKVYPFCAALKQEKFDHSLGLLDEKQKLRIDKYFEQVKKKGFLKIWKTLPSKAIVLVEGKKELAVSKKQFLELLGFN